MFGKNPIRSINYDGSRLAVEEIFYTIQGEGPYSGMAALFIRLSGCNLACTFCDTQFEMMADRPLDVAVVVDDLLSRFTHKQIKFVVITGGEPLRQNINTLCLGLLALGTERIQIETAGTLWQPDLEPLIAERKVVLVCSPKTPRIHPKIEFYCRHWKYIIRDDKGVQTPDGLPGYGTQRSTENTPMQLYRPPVPDRLRGKDTIWVSPCDEYDKDKNLTNQDHARDLVLKFGYRLSLQVHKIVNVA